MNTNNNLTDTSETNQVLKKVATPTEFFDMIGDDNLDYDDYDEPRCNWSPTGESNEDCGEGLDCPPCS